MRHEAIIGTYVATFIDALVHAGVSHAVVSPGSRSTPLAMAIAARKDIKLWMHVDERSAGYFAYGLAKVDRKPVLLLCSSGTAAANYYPAVVEASLARVPLLVLTADRPHELRDVGAPQAIDQVELYGKYTKWFVDMAPPEVSPRMIRYVRTVAARAVAIASAGPAGPVHVNFPFREPLVPEESTLLAGGATRILEVDREDSDGKRSSVGFAKEVTPAEHTDIVAGIRQLDVRQVDALAAILRPGARGLLVVGPYDDPALAPVVAHLAHVLGYPVLADPLSQLRSGPHDRSRIVDGYDTFLRFPQFAEAEAESEPSILVRIGAMPVSKPLTQYIQRQVNCRQIVIDPDVSWRDPTLQASEMVYADPVVVCEMLAERLQSECAYATHGSGVLQRQSHWAKRWFAANAAVHQIAATWIPEREVTDPSSRPWTSELFEGQVIRELQDCLPKGSVLYVANSMPIRDVDTFFQTDDRSIRILANRGANGIDGVVSSALGASAALSASVVLSASQGAPANGTLKLSGRPPVVLVIGDLSFYHDLNGLLAAKLHALDATIVLVNNDGGGIFSFLPQAKYPDRFETLFGTPIGLNFRPVVEMYGGTFLNARTWAEFRHSVSQGITQRGLHVVEVRTQREQNVLDHRAFWKSAEDAVRMALAEL